MPRRYERLAVRAAELGQATDVCCRNLDFCSFGLRGWGLGCVIVSVSGFCWKSCLRFSVFFGRVLHLAGSLVVE